MARFNAGLKHMNGSNLPKAIGVPVKLKVKMPPRFSAPVGGASLPNSHPHLDPGAVQISRTVKKVRGLAG